MVTILPPDGRFGQVSTGVPNTQLQSYQGHQRQPGRERGNDGNKLLPLGAVMLIPSLPVSPTLCDITDFPLEDTLVVRVLDKKP